MRIGILGLLHESNTFVQQRTTLRHFQDDLYLEGSELVTRLGSSHHEIGGFISGLHQLAKDQAIQPVPLMVARATPSGPIAAEALDSLVDHIRALVERNKPLDGLLVAAHGAAVSEAHLDADGYWLSQVRQALPGEVPVIATLDPHANLSAQMVQACTALIAYRTNPHLDQRERGLEAARLMVDTLTGRVHPVMAARFPPLVINIERQCTAEPHLRRHFDLADQQLLQPRVLSNSVLLGFPYADVFEMGASAIVITDADPKLANQFADQLADSLWSHRHELIGQLVSLHEALQLVTHISPTPVCLLDMGDNVGGGSAADGTFIAQSLLQRQLGPALVCIYDLAAVARCQQAGVGAIVSLEVGGHTDQLHGPPLQVRVQVRSLHNGKFCEPKARHGGIIQYDQGLSAVVQVVDQPLTLLLTSKRMVPFSLQQLISCGIQPGDYRILVAKGVHAPLAAYREVCDQFIRVNTPGSTCADLTQ
ncbi:MAG: M81 family metallopeptidase, partial [Pirellulaceae bacterium]|nr:M81 family metallopeptidase [Pirellulaceae bacterium]